MRQETRAVGRSLVHGETDALYQCCTLWVNHRVLSCAYEPRVLHFAFGQTFEFSVRENLVFGRSRVLQLSFSLG